MLRADQMYVQENEKSPLKNMFFPVAFVTDVFSLGKNNFASSSNVTEDITEASQSV